MWLLDILAVWRLTYLLRWERGFWAIGDRFRIWTNIHPEIMLAAACFRCLSIWCALPVALGKRHFLARVLGYSAGAILLEEARKELRRDKQTTAEY